LCHIGAAIGEEWPLRFWQALSFTETDQLLDLARICEEVGFHGAFVSDHLFYPGAIASKYPYSPDGSPPFDAATEFPEPWAAISAMAAVTTSLHFTTAVYLAPLRHPIEVAKGVATASVLSGGRVALGAGVGWVAEEYAAMGQDFRTRGRRLDEMIDLLRKLWTGEMVEHRGRFYELPPLRMSPPPRGRVPIYVGGASDAALRRAARNDGWLGSGNEPAQLPPLLERLRSLRAEAGLAGEPFDAIVALTVPLEPDLVRRVEDAGAGGVVSYPLAFQIGPGTTLDQKRQALESFGETVIARL
jgi:probable F420-dependent oxidoreductase